MALDMEKDTICWLVVSWDDEILNIWKKQFQTTNQIWSWKIPYKWRFIAGNIICKWAIFLSYVE
jgi:hypothetical protein